MAQDVQHVADTLGVHHILVVVHIIVQEITQNIMIVDVMDVLLL